MTRPNPNNILDATEEFMRQAGQLHQPLIDIVDDTFPHDDLRHLRLKLMVEEWSEYIHAEHDNDLIETVDGLLDIIVIAWGTLLAYVGPERAKAAAGEVARSNLDKVNRPGLPIFREDGKILKPEGWQPPDITGALGL